MKERNREKRNDERRRKERKTEGSRKHPVSVLLSD